MNANAKCCAAEEINIVQKDPVCDELIPALIGTETQVKVCAVITPTMEEVGFAILALREEIPKRLEYYIYVEVAESRLEEEERTRISNALYGILAQEAKASYGCKTVTFLAPSSTPSTEQCLSLRRYIALHPDH